MSDLETAVYELPLTVVISTPENLVHLCLRRRWFRNDNVLWEVNVTITKSWYAATRVGSSPWGWSSRINVKFPNPLPLFFYFPFAHLHPHPSFIPVVRWLPWASPKRPATSQQGCPKLMTSHVLQTSCSNQSMAGWQIVPSMYSDKQISAKMLPAACQMCWAPWYGTADAKLSTSHLCFRRDHRCSNLCWTK